jgi:hypothetical protein
MFAVGRVSLKTLMGTSCQMTGQILSLAPREAREFIPDPTVPTSAPPLLLTPAPTHAPHW